MKTKIPQQSADTEQIITDDGLHRIALELQALMAYGYGELTVQVYNRKVKTIRVIRTIKVEEQATTNNE